MTMNYDKERAVNEAARFLPITWREPAPIDIDPVDGKAYYDPDGGGPETYPCIEIGGVQVYAYFEDSVLHVSLDYDTADEAVQGQAGTVPTQITASGTVVWLAG